MSPERVQRIREFADSLANYIQTRNDDPFLKRITYATKPWVLRGELVKAQRKSAKGADLLFSLDEYLQVFEAEDSVGVADWSLVRDLICIRLIELLHKNGWLTAEKLKAEEAEEEEKQAVGTGE